MSSRNLFHTLGDAFAALAARLRFARDALTGAMPLPTPYERTFIMTTHSRLAALEAAVAAANDRLNAMDNAIAQGAATAAADATQAANAAVGALATRVEAIETDLNTDGPAAFPAPASDPSTTTAA